MADAKCYAWSPIRYGADDAGKVKEVKFGEEVTKAKLGVDDDNWAALVDSGAVRTQKPPDMGDYQGSVIEFLRMKAREAATGTVEEAEVEASQATDAPAPEATK